MSEANRAAAPSKAVLITFPPSLDCELSRFVLGHYGIPYEERRHTFFFSFIPTLLHGGTLHFPLLYGDGYPKIDNVRGMIDHFDALCPPDRNLLLSGDDRAKVEADWTQFNGPLAAGTAVFCYFHFLPHRDIMIRPLTEGTPWYEVGTVRLAYPLFAKVLSVAQKLTPESAQQALVDLRQVVDSVDKRLADGRQYLVGTRFSLSDMVLANALAPFVLPPQDTAPVPTLAEMPPEVQSVAKELQSRPCGQFTLRIYRDHRKPAPKSV